MKYIKFISFTVLIFIMYTLYNFNTVFALDSNSIEEGVYIIKSALNENFVFDIEASGKNNGSNLELWTNNKTNNQKFTVKSLGNGTYSISPVHSAMYLDVAGSSKTNGANVAQWKYHGGSNQQWIIQSAGNGYYNIISKCNGLYIDIPRSEAKNGANVQMWKKNSAKNQLFKFEKVQTTVNGKKTIESGTYTIKSALNENYAFDIQGSSKENGANLELWTNNKTSNQKFVVNYLNNGTYSISVLDSGKYLDVSGSKKTNGTNVAQWQYHGGENQQWIIQDAGNGYYNIISKCNGLYIDIAKSQAKNGANVLLWEKNNNKNQMFKFEKVTQKSSITITPKQTIKNGTYLIQSAMDNKYVFDIPGSSKNNDIAAELWTNGSTANQKFAVKYLGDGYYTLRAQHSGKALEVEGASKKLYTNVQQNALNSSDEQQWIIQDAGDGYYYIISKCSELCIGAESASNGINLKMYSLNNTKSVKFKFVVPTPLKGSQTVADGTYIISTALNKKLVLDIPHSSKDDGEKLEIWTNGLTSNQKFNVKYVGDGYYTLTAEHSGKVIEVANANKKLNAAVQQNTANSSDEQKWIIQDAGNGYYNIISKCSELCMDVTNSNGVNGTKIQTNACTNTNAQKFRFCNPNIIINLDESKYPGYIEQIEKLQAKHPNWNFEFLYTGLKFSNAVSGETRVHSRNLVPTSYSGEWICSTCGTKLYDSGWYCASEKATAYYLDPRNFLDEKNVFQFLNVNMYDSNSCTIDGIKQKVSGTFLENYANDVNEACKNKSVNPYYIIARILQEQGSKGTTIGKGMDGGDGKTYYNPFNIGASGNGYTQIYNNALAKAKANGWDSMQKAIEGGIYFCKINWLENYQNTLYQNKFDIDSQNGTNLYEHQYMQNLMGAYSEARTLYSMYSNTGKVDSSFTFIIPIYENMSSTISKYPSSGSGQTSGKYTKTVKTNDGSGCNIRTGAGLSTSIIRALADGTTVTVLDDTSYNNIDGYDWSKIQLSNGTVAFMPSKFLK